ncbi:MAG: cytochrome c peroxidase [Saprospiraceae bacterium]|nr:cytochrome c peroxidase [Saprospiraceae bacterium]
MNRGWLVALFFALILAGCSYETLDYSEVLNKELEQRLESVAGSVEHFKLPDHDDYASIPQDPRNPLTEAKVTLGKFLFFETGIGIDASQQSGMETYSCATCHDPKAAFKPAAQQGVADGGFGYGQRGEMRTKNPAYGNFEVDAQAIRPLSVLNVAFVENTFWNGRFGGSGINEGTEASWTEADGTHLNEMGLEGIETQNIEGLHVHRMRMTEDLADQLGYKDLYDEAFPEFDESERYSVMTTSFAISAYIRSLITDKAPFQQWLRGNKLALTDGEIKGALLFFGKARCFTCHQGPGLSAVEFHALGVKDLHQAHPNPLATSADDIRNLGRAGFTGKEEDMFAFKVPQLYNMKDNPFYFHGGSKTSLEEVVDYKSKAESENPNVDNSQLSPKFQPLDLSDKEKKHLLEFLKHGLYDEDLDRYVPKFIMSGNCFPNNDVRSKQELGCN